MIVIGRGHQARVGEYTITNGLGKRKTSQCPKIAWKHLPEGAAIHLHISEMNIALRRVEDKQAHRIYRYQKPFDPLQKILPAASGS